MAPASRIRIDIYSDIVCPWCFIGTRRLTRVIQSFGGGLQASVRYHPFLLHGDAPPEGVDLRAALRQKYGTDPAPMFARVEWAAREEGIVLDFSRQTRTYSTLGAHTLVRHAEARGTQPGLAEALYAAYFVEARNIADPGVLTDVAGAHGFAPQDVSRLLGDEQEMRRTREDADASVRRGIRGVPVFVLNERYTLPGAQPAGTFREGIIRAMESRSTLPDS